MSYPAAPNPTPPTPPPRSFLGKCQWCREQGHTLTYFPIFKGMYPSIQVPSPANNRTPSKRYTPSLHAPQAHVATTASPPSNAWLLDSGASHHVTNDSPCTI